MKKHKLSIRNKIIFLAVFSCLASLLVFIGYTLPSMKSDLNNATGKKYNYMLNSISDQLADGIREMHQAAGTLICPGGMVSQIYEYLHAEDTVGQHFLASSMVRQLTLTDYSSPVVGTIAYYFPGEPDHSFISNSSRGHNFDFQAQADGYKFFTYKPLTDFYRPHNSVSTNATVLSLTREIGYYMSGTTQKPFSVYVESDPYFLKELFEQATGSEQQLLPVYLLDHHDTILYTSGNTLQGVGSQLNWNVIQNSHIVFTRDTDNWKLVLCTPKSEYYRFYNYSIGSYLIMLLQFLAVYSLLAFFIYRASYTPLKQFVRELSDYGLSGIYQQNRNHSKEFDAYYTQIEKMRTEIRSLISNVETESKQNAYLENQLLLSRINPHFLHNTLSSIIIQASETGQTELVHTLTALNSLLYHNLGKEKVTTLRCELGAVEDYVLLHHRIQHFTYRLACEVPDSMLDLNVPSFILQPIIENSLKHSNTNDLRIVLHLYQEGNCLMIELSDNGQGMSPKKQEELNSYFRENSAQGMGIGLSYVNSSLKYYFGQFAGIVVQDALGHKGARTTIRIEL